MLCLISQINGKSFPVVAQLLGTSTYIEAVQTLLPKVFVISHQNLIFCFKAKFLVFDVANMLNIPLQ
jgi:hypothetical protein